MSFVGTLDYMAPEMLHGRPHSTAADVWSLGVLAAELLTGRPPFYHDTLTATTDAIKWDPPALPNASHYAYYAGMGSTRGAAWHQQRGGVGATSPASPQQQQQALAAAQMASACDCVRAMLHKEPTARPSLAAILEHPWLQK